MAALMVDFGQNWATTQLLASNLYLALIQEAEIGSDWPSNTAINFGNGLTEVTGTGYARITLTGGSWSISGDTGTYAQQTFTVGAGGWTNVRGYAICSASSGSNVLWAESFPVSDQGNKSESDPIRVTPRYQQRTLGE
jgi:hypothetical protein